MDGISKCQHNIERGAQIWGPDTIWLQDLAVNYGNQDSGILVTAQINQWNQMQSQETDANKYSQLIGAKPKHYRAVFSTSGIR